MTSLKRPIDVNPDILSKRPRTDVVIYDRKTDIINSSDVNCMPRTSSLKAPNLQLNGHKGEVFCGKFSPNGSIFTSAGYDQQIFFWDIFNDCRNIGVLSGHSGPILDMQFSNDSEWLYTASVDKTIILWNTETGERLRRLKGHTSFINSISPLNGDKHLFCSGSDDSKIRLWDKRSRNTVHTLDSKFPVLATTYSADGQYIYSSGIESAIHQWDVRANNIVQSLRGHNDTVTGLSLSHDGNWLLSNSRDNTARIWDIRPFIRGGNDRSSYRILMGHTHNAERNLLKCAWSPDGRRVTCGSSERNVHIWDVHTSQPIYRLPGHTGSVNEVAFHPQQPIIASVGSDSRIFMGEIQPF